MARVSSISSANNMGVMNLLAQFRALAAVSPLPRGTLSISALTWPGCGVREKNAISDLHRFQDRMGDGESL